MKTKAGFICLTLLLVFLSLSGVSAMDNSADDIIANDADASLDPANIDVQIM